MLLKVSLIVISAGLIWKKMSIVTLLQVILFTVLFAGNTYNADSIAYSQNYNNILNGNFDKSFEFGFQFLNFISSKIGFSYNEFLLIISSLGLILILSTIRLYTKNISYTFSLYLLYPFIWDTIQIRNFLAMSIIIFGSRYILTTNKKYFKYILCVCLASSMHITSMFYIVGIFVGIKSLKKSWIYITYLSIFFSLLLSIIVPIIVNNLGSRKLEVYLLTSTSLQTKIFLIGYLTCSFCLITIANEIIKLENKVLSDNSQHEISYRLNSPSKLISIKKIENVNLENRLTKFKISTQNGVKKKHRLKIDIDAFVKLNILSLLVIYFLLNNLDFIRLYRNIFILNYTLFGLAIEKCSDSRIRFIFTVLVLIFVFISIYVFSILIPTNNLTEHLFYRNIFNN